MSQDKQQQQPTSTVTDSAPQVPSDLLANFKLQRILDEDPRSRTANLLGTLPSSSTGEAEPVVLLLEKTHFEPSFLAALGGGSVEGPSISLQDGAADTASTASPLGRLECLGQNDVYTWLLAWTSSGANGADIKMTLIHPATEAHIKKYSSQDKIMVRETPEVYASVVEPWIMAQDVKRIAWVYNILEGKKESESVLFRDDDPKEGFVILPDLKWDRKTLSSLYLTCILQDRTLRSMRDLTPAHVPLLKRVREQAAQVARQRFGLGGEGRLRAFVHYQPTFYHLHIHLLSPTYTSHPGAIVGQAHLLDDIIDLLELGVDMRRRTLTYALGERHELLGVLKEAGEI